LCIHVLPLASYGRHPFKITSTSIPVLLFKRLKNMPESLYRRCAELEAGKMDHTLMRLFDTEVPHGGMARQHCDRKSLSFHNSGLH